MNRSTSCLFSASFSARRFSTMSSCMLSTANSSWTSATSLFLARSSSSRSRSLTERMRRSAVRSRSDLDSEVVLARRRVSSSSAFSRRCWNWPLGRRASASSRRRRATRGVSSAEEAGEGVGEPFVLEGAGVGSSVWAWRAAFSASRTEMRSTSCESEGRGTLLAQRWLERLSKLGQ
jgi:hypothetical protein